MPQEKRLRGLNRIRWGLGVAIAAFLLGAPAFPQRPPQDQFAKVTTAQRFLRALYPEVNGKNYIMYVDSSNLFDSDWASLRDLDVSVGPSDPRSGSGYWQKPEALGALFEFRNNDQLNNVYIHFASLQSKSKLLCTQINAHQKWSDQQVIAAMKRAGVKFGPDEEDALRREVPIDALEPFIGRLQIQSAEFFLRHKQSPRSLAELYWEVDGTSVLPNGKDARWSLTLEPFAGRLLSLSRGRE